MIKVNNRKVLDGLMETIGLGRAENARQRLTVLRAIDKLDRLGADGVRALLGDGRKDESGDFTKGAGLDERIRSTKCSASNGDGRDCDESRHRDILGRGPWAVKAGRVQCSELALRTWPRGA